MPTKEEHIVEDEPQEPWFVGSWDEPMEEVVGEFSIPAFLCEDCRGRFQYARTGSRACTGPNGCYSKAPEDESSAGAHLMDDLMSRPERDTSISKTATVTYEMEIPDCENWSGTNGPCDSTGTDASSRCAHFDFDAREECEIPLLEPRTIDDFLSIEPYVDGTSVNIKRAETDEEALVRTAWALLRRNEDLVVFAVCWVTANPDKGDCIVGHLEEFLPTSMVRITVDRLVKYDFSGWPMIFFGGLIRILETGKFKDYVAAWTSGVDEYRYCSAVDLACTLLHELTHVCWRAASDDPGDCRNSYIIENVFRYCMFQRYYGAAVGCCTGLDADDVFYHDGAWWLDESRGSCGPPEETVDTIELGSAEPLPTPEPPPEPPEVEEPPLGGDDCSPPM